MAPCKINAAAFLSIFFSLLVTLIPKFLVNLNAPTVDNLSSQRLIGRSLRQSVNLKYLKDKTIQVDCDVIQADGGTRTASITGGCVALFLAIKNHHDDQRAIEQYVAAISLGVKDDEILVDLDYQEDSTADADINIVMTHNLDLIEIQGTAEGNPFSRVQLEDMMNLAKLSIHKLVQIQSDSLGL